MDDLKKHGVDEVIVFCVNDGAVMNAWAKDQEIPEDGLITFMGDPTSSLVRALDIELTHPGPISTAVNVHTRSMLLSVRRRPITCFLKSWQHLLFPRFWKASMGHASLMA